MVRKRMLSACLIFVMLFSIAGCGDKEDVKKEDLNKTEEIEDAFHKTYTKVKKAPNFILELHKISGLGVRPDLTSEIVY